MTTTYDDLQMENGALREEIRQLYELNKDLRFRNIGLRTQNDDLRKALLQSAARTNQATIAAATYKEAVHHAS